MPCRLGNSRRRFGRAHFVHLHVLCILRSHVPEDFKFHEQHCENLQIHVGFELSRFSTLDLFTYTFLVKSVPCVSFILIVSCLNQQLMHLFYTSLYITFSYAFRRTSAPSSESQV